MRNRTSGLSAGTGRLRRPGRPRRRAGAGGFTLVEVTVAMLVLAMVSVGVFSVLLSSRMNEVNSDYQQQAVVFQQRLDDALMKFDGYLPAAGNPDDLCKALCGTVCGAGNCFDRLIVPGNPALSDGAGYSDCGPGANVHAFTAACLHNADSLLPAWFLGAPFNGHLCYRVHAFASGAQSLYQVNSMVAWNGTPCNPPP